MQREDNQPTTEELIIEMHDLARKMERHTSFSLSHEAYMLRHLADAMSAAQSGRKKREFDEQDCV